MALNVFGKLGTSFAAAAMAVGTFGLPASTAHAQESTVLASSFNVSDSGEAEVRRKLSARDFMSRAQRERLESKDVITDILENRSESPWEFEGDESSGYLKIVMDEVPEGVIAEHAVNDVLAHFPEALAVVTYTHEGEHTPTTNMFVNAHRNFLNAALPRLNARTDRLVLNLQVVASVDGPEFGDTMEHVFSDSYTRELEENALGPGGVHAQINDTFAIIPYSEVQIGGEPQYSFGYGQFQNDSEKPDFVSHRDRLTIIGRHLLSVINIDNKKLAEAQQIPETRPLALGQ